jgi:hypothetical protein
MRRQHRYMYVNKQHLPKKKKRKEKKKAYSSVDVKLNECREGVGASSLGVCSLEVTELIATLHV